MMTEFPRQKIASELTDLRQMRGALSDIISAACRILSMVEARAVSDDIKLRVVAAMSAAEEADKLTQTRMRYLYAMPTEEAANANEKRAIRNQTMSHLFQGMEPS